MYKVLDVREIMKTRHYVIVIAYDVNFKERRRFAFYKHSEECFGNEVRHWGYTGDYDVLVPGDMFVIEQTPTGENVKIIEEV